MSPTLTPQAFVAKWQQNIQKESAAAKEHFADLCHILGVPTPNDPGSGPDTYCFEKSLTKTGGSAGFADVWRKDRFAWEYKGKKKTTATLDAAYAQLLLYKEDLGNPPILVVCDIANYEVHIAFTGYRTRVEKFTNADLANANTRELLRLVFTDPERLRPVERQETITELAAGRLAQIAQFLEKRGYAPSQIAPFFMKLLFALFAEDIHLLPGELLTQSIRQAIFKPSEFAGRAGALFRAMRVGDYFGTDRVPQFDGWLFDDQDVLPLNADELQYLAEAAKLDWSQVEPAIFGTLFERSLDPSKRAQLGLHYTSRDDILLIVEPVLMQPLRREWDEVKAQVEVLRPSWEAAMGALRQRLRGQMEGALFEFMERLSNVRVLDAACGSGNFLYVALNQLKNLEKEVWTYAGGVGLTQPELGVSPAQLHGIEKNQFAAELAQVVVWIGYLQWLRNNGFLEGAPQEPILQNLHNIECRDAILTVDLHGNPAEPEWPETDVIIGNPPFLGGKRLRAELGDQYVNSIFALYDGRVPREADLVTYWFERARAFIADGKVKRAGLLATNSIRGGASRHVLERIKQTGDIFMAWDDRAWVLDGAAVRVSIVGFDHGDQQQHILNGKDTGFINPNLTGSTDLTTSKLLRENTRICLRADEKGGPFHITDEIAQQMLSASLNINGRPNSDVILRWATAIDIVRRPRNMWIIDFGVDMTQEEAAKYELPFRYVEEHVKPVRATNNIPRLRDQWWIHRIPGANMRMRLSRLGRYIATPVTAKYRIFTWLDASILPDITLTIFARDDDYFFGVLHSKAHELWALQTGGWMGVGNDPRYTPTSTFETFPFPWPPGKEPQGDPRVQAIAEAARELVRLRDQWLAGEGLPDLPLNQRTLTNLYNKRPDWLHEAHTWLDATVFDAYGWPHDLSDDEILARLLALNLERAAAQGGVPVALGDSDTEADQDNAEHEVS
jgi:type II restriction/modification system DNA methylase subunit YeeA